MSEAKEAVKELNENLSEYKEQIENRVDEHGETIQGFDDQLEAHDEKMKELEEELTESMKKVDEAALDAQKPGGTEQAKPEAKRVFGKQLKEWSGETDVELTEDERRVIEEGFESRALIEDSDAHNLVPKEIQDEIIESVADQTVLRSLVSSMSIDSNRTEFKNLSSGVSMSFNSAPLEAGGNLPAEATPGHGSTKLYVEDMYGLAKIGKNLLEDNIWNLAQIVQEEYAQAKANLEDTKFLNGSGHSSNEPEGLLSAGSDYEINTNTSNTVEFDDLMDLMFGKGSTDGKLKSVYRNNGVFLMHPFTMLFLVKKQVTSAASFDGSNSTEYTYEGSYMWQPSMQAGVPNTFRGKPVYTHDDLTSEGSLSGSEYAAVFGDLNSAYRIIDRTGLTVQTLKEFYATAGQIGYLFHARVGGGVLQPEAVRLLKDA